MVLGVDRQLDRYEAFAKLETVWRDQCEERCNALRDEVAAQRPEMVKQMIRDTAIERTKNLEDRAAEIRAYQATSSEGNDGAFARHLGGLYLAEIEERLRRLAWQLKPARESDDLLSDVMIERARQYPIRSLLPEVNRAGFVSCPFHRDRKPSFYSKPDGTFAYCFSCGESCDSIGYLMKVRGMTFREAVEALQ